MVRVNRGTPWSHTIRHRLYSDYLAGDPDKVETAFGCGRGRIGIEDGKDLREVSCKGKTSWIVSAAAACATRVEEPLIHGWLERWGGSGAGS